jgi:Indigoidine synthase A like protein
VAANIVCTKPAKLYHLTHFGKAFDVSADLHDLSRCPVGLVSAGVKSILDIGRLVYRLFYRDNLSYCCFVRTLEYLVNYLPLVSRDG